MGPNDLLGSRDPIAEALNLNYKGLPFVGKPYTVGDDNKPVIARKVHVKQFNLSDKKDLEEYNSILQKVADATSLISYEEKVYDDEIKSWRILLRWLDLMYVAPKIKKEVTEDE